MKRLAYVDAQLFNWITQYAVSSSQLRSKCFKWISRTGDGYLYILMGAVFLYFDKQHGELFFYTACLAYSFEIPIFLFLKHMFKRQRPCDLLQHVQAYVEPSDKFSLPSGHTAAAFLMATIVMHFYPSFFIVAYAWASLVGLSRIVLRVHFPLDVIIGACLGISVALFSISVLR